MTDHERIEQLESGYRELDLKVKRLRAIMLQFVKYAKAELDKEKPPKSDTKLLKG